MRGFDFSPLYRSTVGFDQLQSLLDSVTQDTSPTYPPYNIERTSENDYRITVAVAGFGQDDLDIEVNHQRQARRARRDQLSLSRDRRPQLRTPLPACRSCRGARRPSRERAPSCGPRAARARSAEAAPDRDFGTGQGREDARGQSRDRRRLRHPERICEGAPVSAPSCFFRRV